MLDKLTRHQIDALGSRVSGGMVAAAVARNKVGILRNILRRLMGPSCLVSIIGLTAFEQSFAGSKKAFIPRETSTIPANGDVNPYGVAFVPNGFPTTNSVSSGDILVSNFNNKKIPKEPGQRLSVFHAVDDAMNVVTAYDLAP